MVIREKGGRPAGLTFGVVGGDEFDQRGPGHYLIHLVQERLLAGCLGTEIEGQGDLFNAMYFIAKKRVCNTFLTELCKVSLELTFIHNYFHSDLSAPSANPAHIICKQA